jgi:hypothetical protein
VIPQNEITQNIFLSILIDVLFGLFPKFSGVFSNGRFSQHMPFLILTFALSPTSLFLSLSLSLAYFRTLFYLPLFGIKRN